MAGDMHNTSLNVSLPDSLASFVAERVAEGGYASASDYMRELIHRAQKEREEDERLEQLILEGIDSGPGIEATPEYWAKKRAELIERHGGKSKR